MSETVYSAYPIKIFSPTLNSGSDCKISGSVVLRIAYIRIGFWNSGSFKKFTPNNSRISLRWFEDANHVIREAVGDNKATTGVWGSSCFLEIFEIKLIVIK